MIGLFAARLSHALVACAFGGFIIMSLASNEIPVGFKRHDPSAAMCAVGLGSSITGQQRLLVTATGLSPSWSYAESQTDSKTGLQSAMVMTDATGAVSDQSLFYMGHGTYSIAFDYYYWRNSQLVQATATTCSAQL